jgi:hypothetical protein
MPSLTSFAVRFLVGTFVGAVGLTVGITTCESPRLFLFAGSALTLALATLPRLIIHRDAGWLLGTAAGGATLAATFAVSSLPGADVATLAAVPFAVVAYLLTVDGWWSVAGAKLRRMVRRRTWAVVTALVAVVGGSVVIAIRFAPSEKPRERIGRCGPALLDVQRAHSRRVPVFTPLGVTSNRRLAVTAGYAQTGNCAATAALPLVASVIDTDRMKSFVTTAGFGAGPPCAASTCIVPSESKIS